MCQKCTCYDARVNPSQEGVLLEALVGNTPYPVGDSWALAAVGLHTVWARYWRRLMDLRSSRLEESYVLGSGPGGSLLQPAVTTKLDTAMWHRNSFGRVQFHSHSRQWRVNVELKDNKLRTGKWPPRHIVWTIPKVWCADDLGSLGPFQGVSMTKPFSWQYYNRLYRHKYSWNKKHWWYNFLHLSRKQRSDTKLPVIFVFSLLQRQKTVSL